MTTEIEKAAAIIKSGQPVIFPTDTVWGIGVSVAHCASPKVLFDIKGRPACKPVAWLISDINDLRQYGCDVSDYAIQIAKDNWPGAMTLVVNASEAVPIAYASGAGTVALRVPDSNFVRQLISAVGSPLAVTSANLSGHCPHAANEPLGDVFASVAKQHGVYIVESVFDRRGVSACCKPSQVLDCTGSVPITLRS